MGIKIENKIGKCSSAFLRKNISDAKFLGEEFVLPVRLEAQKDWHKKKSRCYKNSNGMVRIWGE